MLRRIETIRMGRGGGKSSFLADRVAALQDEGYDPVVVIVPDAKYVDHWFDMLMDHEIDPSRIIIMPISVYRDKIHGFDNSAFLIDDGDRIDNLRDVVYDVIQQAANDVLTITITNPVEGI